MKQKKSEVNQITNINIDKLSKSQYTYINNKIGYCSKCLRELDENRVVDAEGNEFCDKQCRREYLAENKKELESCFSEWKFGRR